MIFFEEFFYFKDVSFTWVCLSDCPITVKYVEKSSSPVLIGRRDTNTTARNDLWVKWIHLRHNFKFPFFFISN